MAQGVRRAKAVLAAAVELFEEFKKTQVAVIPGSIVDRFSTAVEKYKAVMAVQLPEDPTAFRLPALRCRQARLRLELQRRRHRPVCRGVPDVFLRRVQRNSVRGRHYVHAFGTVGKVSDGTIQKQAGRMKCTGCKSFARRC